MFRGFVGDEILPSDEGMIKISIITIPIQQAVFPWLKRMVMKGDPVERGPSLGSNEGVFLVFLLGWEFNEP